MAAPLSDDRLLAALRKWLGSSLREYSGWRTRGRPQTWGPVYGVVIHHTGSDAQSDGYLNFLFDGGRPEEGIPAPLCNAAGEMDGDVWLGSAGRANDSGRGSSRTLAHVRAGDYGYDHELTPGPDDTDGNRHFYDLEVMYDGGQSMTDPQYASAVRFAAALCDAHGWSALSVIGHKEWSGRKWDPGKCDMARFRRDVRTQLAAGPTNQEDDDMTPEQAKQLADVRKIAGNIHTLAEVIDHQVKWTRPDGGGLRAGIVSATTQVVAPLQARVSGLEVLVGQLVAGQGVDPAPILAAIAEAADQAGERVKAALKDFEVTVSLDAGDGE